VKFLLTQELGRLAKWLRILGLDVAYSKERSPGSVMIQALREDRIILTRNHRFPESRGIKITVLKSETLKEQLREALEHLNISLDTKHMFTRCLICNEELVGVKKEKIKDKVPEYVYKTQDDFVTCPQCERVYWRGTHWGNVHNILKAIQ
jgi:uncharacterized protein with PIN domain